MAASEGKDSETVDAPKSAGEDLLSLLKKSAGPPHEKHERSVDINALLGSQQTTMDSMPSSFFSPQVEHTVTTKGHAPSNPAGRKLLGLLKPEVLQKDLVRPNTCSDMNDRIALGIWDALGQAPKSVSF
jgi:hypothetical protein